MTELDHYYDQKNEPVRGCLLFLRHYLLTFNPYISEVWKHKTPFFHYKEKAFCYLLVEKKSGLPYIGMVKGHLIEHPTLEEGNRSSVKIMYIDPHKDIPVHTIHELLNMLLQHYEC